MPKSRPPYLPEFRRRFSAEQKIRIAATFQDILDSARCNCDAPKS